MTWSTVPIAVSGTVATANWANTVRDDLNYLFALMTASAVQVRRTTNDATHASGAAMTFDAEDADTDSYHSTSVNTSRLTCPSGKDGLFQVWAQIYAGNGNNPILTVAIKRSDGTVVAAVSSDKVSTTNPASPFTPLGVVALTAGQYVEVFVTASDGTACIVGDSANGQLSRFGMYRIGS